MELLQNELMRVVGNAKHIDICDVPNLSYLCAMVKETMRMHLVVPLLIRSNGLGFGSNQTEPLNRGLTIYQFIDK